MDVLNLIKLFKNSDSWESHYAFLNSFIVLVKAFPKNSTFIEFISIELIGENG